MSPAEFAAFYEALQELARVTERAAAWQRDGAESIAMATHIQTEAIRLQTEAIERQSDAMHELLSDCPICGVTPAKAIACSR